MPQATVLNASHRALGARMVDFGGWEMPISYGSQIEEHHAVRRDAGMFDVSHMTVVDLRGERVREFLATLLANDVAKLKKPGKALYTCMLNDDGGVIDDLIVYFVEPSWFRLVVNAATREKDLAWIRRHAGGFAVEVAERADLGIIAVQGPNARARLAGLLDGAAAAAANALARFSAARVAGPDGGELFVARTGYTGEDGFEVVLPQDQVVALWDRLRAAGVAPAGLGARDTLRLEAGMNLYGQDMDDTVTPLEAGLSWTVSMGEGRAFIGRDALQSLKDAGVPRQTVGIVMDDKGVLRHGQRVLCAGGEGEVLSGTFSPTLGCAIGLARIPAGDPGTVRVDIRGREVPVRVVKPPFVREGEVQPGVLCR